MAAGSHAAVVARRFHDTVIAMVREAALAVSAKTGLRKVALSGGSWQNRYLTGVARQVLRDAGFTVLKHRLAPANDGGLALGQALVAAKQQAAGVAESEGRGNAAR